MEVIIDVGDNLMELIGCEYKGELVRCRECRKKYSCVTFEGIGNEDGFCSMGETEREHIISTWNVEERE